RCSFHLSYEVFLLYIMKLINDKRLFLIDSFIYIYKYYYYYKKYYNNDSIILGYINFIINILINKQPTYIIVVFDGKIKKNLRKIFYSNYKLNRAKIPFNLTKNLVKIKKILFLLNIKYITKKYIEADDIIGSLVKISEKKGFINYIYTEDKDYYQLVSKSTLIIKKNILINKKFILKKYNIKSIKQYIDLISLIGDKSDNIPGIPYIGLKTASELLNIYNNIENIYLNIHNIKKSIKKKIEYYKYIVTLSKKLIKINKNIKIKKKYWEAREKISTLYIIKILFTIKKSFFLKKYKIINKYLYL
ncbi:MAG: hypothetical protein NHF90_00790, partial [Candidatus Shikimatogenerans sp. JK-2022]|nr:hypothetical protein [Candidatus Shikimatogenerans bostrichidophilus]